MLKKQVNQLQKDAALRNAPLRLVGIFQQESADLKKFLSWYREEGSALKLLAQTRWSLARRQERCSHSFSKNTI